MATWMTAGRIPLEDFLEKGVEGYWPSSEAGRSYAAHYDNEEHQLFVTFNGPSGGSYVYNNVSPLEARSFYFAASKGRWIWSYLRVRGSATSHRKLYFKLD